jgi:hypothetical protein
MQEQCVRRCVSCVDCTTQIGVKAALSVVVQLDESDSGVDSELEQLTSALDALQKLMPGAEARAATAADRAQRHRKELAQVCVHCACVASECALEGQCR